MNVFSRFIDIINANINAMLDKAEDPEKMLRLMIQEMEDTQIELKSSCASDMAHISTLERELKSTSESEKRWAERARMAVERGKDDMAREALSERREAAREAERLTSLIKELKDGVEQAKEEIARLDDKLEESKDRLRTMEEKAEREKSERMSRERARREREMRFEEMEMKIDRHERKTNHGGFDDEEIEKELEALKSEAGR